VTEKFNELQSHTISHTIQYNHTISAVVDITFRVMQQCNYAKVQL